jgi:pimeloyl-ACP methyl ester carboxylesterase
MNAAQEGTLEVPGASLYYKVRGTGPLLLILQGGAADADGSEALGQHLVDAYTIVTYDRRGLSRSKLNNASDAPGIETHSQDAHHLLAALTPEPAFVVGFSLGALIGLDLVARHPEQVRVLVAHEPAAIELLPDTERALALQTHEEVEELYRRGGVAAAMKKMVQLAGVNFDDREPDVNVTPPVGQQAARMAANMGFLLTHDLPAVRHYKPDLSALEIQRTLILPAIGRNSGAIVPRHSALALAERLGLQAVEFPGGHTGYVLRPREFASRLRQVLNSSRETDRGNLQAGGA